MKLAVLGASGQTGLCLVKQALSDGHQVVAIVRSPEKMGGLKDEKLKVVDGNIYSPESLHPLFEGCDAVISCLGTNTLFSTVTMYSQSCNAIVAAMRQARVLRLVFISSWYMEVDRKDDPGFVARWFVRPFLKKILIDMHAMEQYLVKECQDIDYTSVRPPQLTNGKVTEKEFIVAERQFVESAIKISRADVARFMLHCACAQSDQYKKKLLAIGVPS